MHYPLLDQLTRGYSTIGGYFFYCPILLYLYIRSKMIFKKVKVKNISGQKLNRSKQRKSIELYIYISIFS